MKLELKHLAPYLPYGLEALDYLSKRVKIIGLKNETYFIDSGNIYAYGDIQDCKPILHPLSDLEEFSPAIYDYLINKCEGYTVRLQYVDFKTLLENHFDVFGLIEQGLAIDINTLNK